MFSGVLMVCFKGFVGVLEGVGLKGARGWVSRVSGQCMQ